jgi:ABC-2 type transport system permease protein
MLPIIIVKIKDRLLSLIIYCLSAIGFLWMYVALFPSFSDQAEDFQDLFEVFPEGMMDAFGFEGEMYFENINNFLATEMFSFIWPILVIAIGVGIAGSAIAGEIEKNTIETLLAQPISRTKLFFSKYLAGLANIIIFTLISIYSIVPLAEIYNLEYATDNYFLFVSISFLFALSIYSISFLISSLTSKKSLVSFISVGIIVLMYVLNIVANLKESVESIKYSSFFYYYNPTNLLGNGEILDYTYLAFGGTILLSTIAAWYIFNRRDIAV